MSRSSCSELELPAMASIEGETTMTRTSLVESFRACGIAGARLDKEYLRRRVTVRGLLRVAMAEAIRSMGPPATAAVAACGGGRGAWPVPWGCRRAWVPMIVFVNYRSGSRHGPVLKGRLQELMGEKQVFYLSMVKPSEFVQYGLGCL